MHSAKPPRDPFPGEEPLRWAWLAALGVVLFPAGMLVGLAVF